MLPVTILVIVWLPLESDWPSTHGRMRVRRTEWHSKCVQENDNGIKIPTDQTRMLACDWLESTTNPHLSKTTPIFSFFILSLSISCMYYHLPFFFVFFAQKGLFPSLLYRFAHGQKNCAKLDAWNGKGWKWKGCVRGLTGDGLKEGGWKFYGTKRSNFWRCFMSWMRKPNGASPVGRKDTNNPLEKKSPSFRRKIVASSFLLYQK